MTSIFTVGSKAQCGVLLKPYEACNNRLSSALCRGSRRRPFVRQTDPIGFFRFVCWLQPETVKASEQRSATCCKMLAIPTQKRRRYDSHPCELYSRSNIGLPLSYFAIGVTQTLMTTPLNVYLVKTIHAEPKIQNTLGVLVNFPWSLKVCVFVCVLPLSLSLSLALSLSLSRSLFRNTTH